MKKESKFGGLKNGEIIVVPLSEQQIERSMESALKRNSLIEDTATEEDQDNTSIYKKSPLPDIRRTYDILRWEIPNYKHIDLLFRSIAYNGKILSARFTKADIAQQRKLSKSVKQARILGLLPFVHKDFDRSHL